MVMESNEIDETPVEKIKILIIDDDANFLFGITRMLTRANYEVLSATDGMHGIQKAQLEMPDLILLDINMPKMTGFQVKMVLNRFPVTQLIPVVFLSALNDRANVLNGLNLADDYITKPFDADILIARLKNILRRIAPRYRQAIQISANATYSIETLQLWGQSVEMFDAGTAGHTLRVTSWAVALARSLGLGGEEVENIRKGSMLHDIGKLAVPEFILNKPGPLTNEEWKIVREHPRLGYEMISPIKSLSGALDIPMFHHERWDGFGYPDQLSEDKIPLSARIFSIVDVHDALLSKRPYKPAMDDLAVRDMIRSQSGKHFDPAIVEHFLEHYDSLRKEVENEFGKNNFSH